jgi:hypothetical protein
MVERGWSCGLGVDVLTQWEGYGVQEASGYMTASLGPGLGWCDL